MNSEALVVQNNRRINPDTIEIDFWTQESISVFESMRVYDGVIFKLEEHLTRLFESARSVGLKLTFSREAAEDQLLNAVRISNSTSAFVRLTATASCFWIIVEPLKVPKPEQYDNGVSLITSTIRRNGIRSSFPQAKTSNYLPGVLAKAESDISLKSEQSIHETILLNAYGEVQECRTGNLFIVKKGRLFTPPLSGILDGVTRRCVIELAVEAEIPCHEKILTRHDIYNADEAFLTYTSAEILPVCQIDGRRIGERCPGAITQDMHFKYQELVREYVEARRC